jgi:hypothetical protein
MKITLVLLAAFILFVSTANAESLIQKNCREITARVRCLTRKTLGASSKGQKGESKSEQMGRP